MEFLLYSISCHICIFSFNLKYQKLIGSSVKSFLNLPPEGFQWSVMMYIRFWIPKQVGSLQPLWTFLRRIPTTKTSEDNNLLRLLATNDENILLAFSSAVKDCQFPMHVIPHFVPQRSWKSDSIPQPWFPCRYKCYEGEQSLLRTVNQDASHA